MERGNTSHQTLEQLGRGAGVGDFPQAQAVIDGYYGLALISNRVRLVCWRGWQRVNGDQQRGLQKTGRAASLADAGFGIDRVQFI